MKVKKKVKKKEKLGAFERELAHLVKFFNRNDEESTKLWSVITALRGPDSDGFGSYERKCAVTGVIRYMAGLGSLSRAVINNPDSPNRAEVRKNITRNGEDSEHFRDHAYRAFEALGLLWGKDNPIKKRR